MTSSLGSAQCTKCLDSFYRVNGSSSGPHPFKCEPCLAGGAICAEGTSLATVELPPGRWRLSGASEEVAKCFISSTPDSSNTTGGATAWSPCKGGIEIGFEGEGYCNTGYTGPRVRRQSNSPAANDVRLTTTRLHLQCERCTNISKYYLSREGRCEDCPAVEGRVMLILGPLVGATGVVVCVAIAAARMTPSTYRWLARWWEHFRMWLSTVALIPKLKTIGHLPAVYSLELPDSYYEWLSFLDVFEIDWSGLAIPGTCLVGGFRSRLWLRGVGPLMLMVVAFLFAWLGRISFYFIRSGNDRVPWITSLLKALPLVLFIAFVLVTGTSSSIFAVWTCEQFDVDSIAEPPVKMAFLIADTSMSEATAIASNLLHRGPARADTRFAAHRVRHLRRR
eukprot:769801-Prymnesium_polylepis.1